ncbi:MAG: PHP domain-containing protein [Peptococcaceae bacterium]|nr:PHP domain-containing protein [Peptococcaceae bacterium]
MKADFHIHSTFSDGLLSPELLLERAYEKNVELMAFTDHEHVTVTPRLTALAESLHIRLIPGVEFLTRCQGRDVHLLAYFSVCPRNCFLRRVQELREQRSQATYHLVQRLRRMGVNLVWPDEGSSDEGPSQLSSATKTHSHVMYGLRKIYPHYSSETLREIVASACDRDSLAVYEPPLFTDLVDLISSEGGLPVIAHPGLLQDYIFVEKLLTLRKTALEVYYGYWYDADELIRVYECLGRRLALAATGGSDYHGGFSRVDIGDVVFPENAVHVFLRVLNECCDRNSSKFSEGGECP